MNEAEATRQQHPDLLLKIEGLEVHYGGVQALTDVSLSVRRGEVVTVIGANGAGKSSLLNAIVGVVPAQATALRYAGADISRMSPEALVRRGITLVPERRELFADLTVEDNLRLGAYTRSKDGSVREDLAQVYSIFPRLAERKRQRANTMSGGEQQMLAVGRAMMAKPQLLLLDEPSLGLAPLIVQEIFRVLGQLKEAGTTVLVIEQNARAALNLADYGYVLETGKVVLSAPADELFNDSRVREAYLGVAPRTGE
ncbi:MAG: branched-chain amino acid ABC transporter, ATP-binding protein LivF [Burkholderiaceae bacterium]|nr:MAG: branched-chain amino acid ABC transporter, ATP-binding protein LivF [Burkholderiaceae bacterium]